MRSLITVTNRLCAMICTVAGTGLAATLLPGAAFAETPLSQPPSPLSPALLLAVAACGLAMAWNLTLRKRLNAKNRELTLELAQRQSAEKELRASRHRLATLVSNLPGMAFSHRVDKENWPMDYTSEGCQELTGYKSLCAPGMELCYAQKVVHPDDIGPNRETIMEALAEKKPYRLIYRITTASGEKKWVWEQGVGLYGPRDEFLSVDGFVTDITEFKRAEKALKASRKQFLDLVVNSPVGISIIQGNRVVYQNPEQERLFGPMQDNGDVFSHIAPHDDDRESIKRFIEVVQSGEVTCNESDFCFLPSTEGDKGPKTRWVHCRAARIVYQEKESVLLNMIDVTRAKELEHMVGIKDKMASLGRVTAGIAHEIRNPLSGINLYLGVLEKVAGDPGQEEKTQKCIRQLKEASCDIETVIRRAMDFLKPGMPLFRVMDANEPVTHALGLTEASLRKNDIRVETSLSKEPLPCYADSNLLLRVMMNLIHNAAEAMEELPGPRVIQVNTTMESGRVLISVSDSGPGVPQRIRDCVFDPFYTTKSDGTGIGLSLSQRIVMDHNGTIRIGQGDLGGASFVIDIPARQAMTEE
ncbi:ATP-binding protein [Desulfoluna butyratoxydans]|uniref:histidine kinase n=1 Tax=Desulfoluna butyratoxydans TaxID=231438 RepID=A0A4U8YUM3_9BACT|nr:ATP-binding protein [Desulfoluna butyratoxydans]VFQ45602.1 pas fold-3 [Desulfoluna butyratoxydans]